MVKTAPRRCERVIPQRGARGWAWYTIFQADDPLLKKARLDHLARVPDLVIGALVANSRTFADERRRCTNPPPKVGDNVVHSMVDAKRELAASLHGAVDGCGLRASRASHMFTTGLQTARLS